MEHSFDPRKRKLHPLTGDGSLKGIISDRAEYNVPYPHRMKTIRLFVRRATDLSSLDVKTGEDFTAEDTELTDKPEKIASVSFQIRFLVVLGVLRGENS